MYNYKVIPADKESFDVDVIMVTYQHASYIKEAIESVLMQKTEYAYRLIIIDDASNDGTQEIICEYQKRYSDRIMACFANENTKGQIQRYFLEKIKMSDYVANLEGDDYWTDKYKLQKQFTFLKLHPEYVAIAGNVQNVDEDGTRQHRDFDMYPFREEHIYTKENVLNMEQVAHISTVMSRNYMKEWGRQEFESFYECKMNGDVTISSILGILGDVYYSHDIYGNHRRVFTGDSYTAKTHNKNNAKHSIEMWTSLYEYLDNNYGFEIPKVKAYCEEQKKLIGIETASVGNVDECAKQRNISRMYDMWLLANYRGMSLEKLLQIKGVKSVVIYGLAS